MPRSNRNRSYRARQAAANAPFNRQLSAKRLALRKEKNYRKLTLFEWVLSETGKTENAGRDMYSSISEAIKSAIRTIRSVDEIREQRGISDKGDEVVLREYNRNLEDLKKLATMERRVQLRWFRQALMVFVKGELQNLATLPRERVEKKIRNVVGEGGDRRLGLMFGKADAESELNSFNHVRAIADVLHKEGLPITKQLFGQIDSLVAYKVNELLYIQRQSARL